MLRAAVLLAVSLFAVDLHAQVQGTEAPAISLQGKINKNVYISPSGAFSVPIPVLPELGGSIQDTSNVVTFRDKFSVMISIGAFPMDATEKWHYSTQTPKEYLVNFFGNVVINEFRREYPKLQIESQNGLFIPTLAGGSFLAYFLIPDGSAFAAAVDPFAMTSAQQHPVAKRANIVFVKNNVTFVISTELAERVTEGVSYKLTTEQENKTLRKRLEDLIASMNFMTPGKPASP